MKKLTLTAKETAELCHEYGWRVTQQQIAQGIAEGRFPFGRVVNIGPTGRKSYEIWVQDVLDFLKEKGAEI